MTFKMAATAELSLTLDPMGKMFQNASSLKPLGKLKPNSPGMIIGMSFTKLLFFYADRKSKMAANAGHRLTLNPMGTCSNMNIMRYGVNVNEIKVKLYQKCLLLRNYISDSIQTTQECSLDSPLQSLGFLF
jgi:hypothetical protein